MKKSILFMMAAVAMLFTACDPVVDNSTLDPMDYSADELADAVTFKVYKDEACTQEAGAAEGNYVKYFTNPGIPVSILNYNSAGEENILSVGPQGSFKLSPKRGQSTDQELTIRVVKSDNTTVEATKTVSVWVKSDLDPELKLLLGEGGKKKWGWAEDGYEVWGNAGNSGGGSAFTAYNVDGKWWGVTESAELANSQMAHCAGDETNGAKYAATGSYMLFDEDGNITTCTADGSVIAQSSYTFSNYDATRASGWSIGTLSTKKASVLWPYSINEGGKQVTDFDVMYLDANHMTLVYTKGNAAGSWGEITYWRFENLTPSADALENADKWYWASDGYECWGNAGNSGGGSAFTWNNVDGKWWGVTAAADLSGQMQHSGDGNLGDADNDAYMIFKDGKVTSYGSDGSTLRSGTYELSVNADGRDNGWALGTLSTSAPALLFPWSINEGGVGVTKFDVMSYTGGFMTLVYTKGNAAGSWGEITYWRFSTKH